MDLKELNIIALAKSESSKGNFVLVLEEVKGFRRIAIIIGAFEAQAIAIALENMSPDRPLTHDLTLNLLQLSHQLERVILSDYRDEIFFAQLVLKSGTEEVVMDSRASDAIALAIRQPCSIYTTEKVLEQAGVILDSPGKSFGEKRRSFEMYSLPELNQLLEKLIEKEDYESARKIRDIINQKLNKKD